MVDIASLASSIFAEVNENRAEVMITGLSTADDSPEETFVFQFFPEQVSDSKQTNFQRKEVPGGTLPIYQWIQAGERLISFSATFTCDNDFLAHGTSKAGEIYERMRDAGLQRHNVDIRTAVAYLRTFLLPRYGEDAGLGIPRTMPPRKLRLTIPRSAIGLWGGMDAAGVVMPDSIVAVMTQCEVTVEAYFPSGLPRIVTVQLSFAQVPQLGRVVSFPQSPMDSLPAISNQGGGGGWDLGGAISSLGGSFGGLFGGSGNDSTLGSLQPYTLQPRKLEG